MTGKEFEKRLAKKCKVTQKDARDITKAFVELIRSELEDGGFITFTGLGRFYTVPYNRKTIVTPQGEEIKIKPHNVAKFKPSKLLKDNL